MKMFYIQCDQDQLNDLKKLLEGESGVKIFKIVDIPPRSKKILFYLMNDEDEAFLRLKYPTGAFTILPFQ